MSKFYLLLLIFCISSCGRSELGVDLREFYSQKNNYLLIIEKLADFQQIDSVDPDVRLEIVQNSKNFDRSTVDAYNELTTMVESLDLRRVVAIRNLHTRELLGVSFVMPFPLLDWSSVRLIKYIDARKNIESFIPPSAKCNSIESPNWHFCTYNTQ